MPINEDEPDEEGFHFNSKIELHACEGQENLQNIVSLCTEHAFRGIATSPARISKLVKEINKSGNNDIVPICLLDFPYGDSSSDIRAYSIHSAKEKGAKEIEISAAYHLINSQDWRELTNEIKNIQATAEKANIGYKYIIDNCMIKGSAGVATRLCRIISQTKIPIVSVSSGLFDKKEQLADNILKMRNIKHKGGSQIKVFISSSDVNDIASYVKAGADIIGLKWNKAPNLVHQYEDMVQNRE